MFICIAKTTIEWGAWLESAQRALGRSITCSLDKEHLPTAGVPSFVCTLDEFMGAKRGLQEQMASGPKKHAMFTFIVNLPREEFVTLASFGLTVTPADVGDFAVVSGRLSDWVQAVVDATNSRVLRPFACLMLSWFETQDLGPAWGNWRKEDIASERLFRLIPN